jgi:hypothetical protein
LRKTIVTLLIVCLIFISGDVFGATIKQRVKSLEGRINQLENDVLEINTMVQAKMPSDLNIYMDENDPTEPGDIKVVRGTPLVLDNADSVAGWSVVSGTALLALSSSPYEGTGCVRVQVSGNGTVVIKTTFGAQDLSAYKYVSSYIKKMVAANLTVAVNIIDDGGDRGPDAPTSLTTNVWLQRQFNISSYTSAERNVVTAVEFTFVITGMAGGPGWIFIDNVFADPGPSQLKHNDGDRVYIDSPKFYPGTYEGTTAHKTVIIPRKGVPAYIRTICLDTDEIPVLWMKGFGELSMQDYAVGGWFAAGEGIHNVVDGAFDLYGAAPGCNTNGQTYVFMVLYED